ncbi:DUF1254 domain-containing protein [Sphingomonas sp. TZW2008]|uniref:DUF1254 domain-containing protein n=1 Tax=Sphingomonas sp. TZW2008 TaxID=1917973 RepID=UPI001C4FE4B5|nr:DUF1254 domain-containing protein [Sphingomonas sp. TZW2008]
MTYFFTLSRTPTTLMSAAISRLSEGGVNRFTHAPLATDKSRAIVRPSPDLAYSSCPYDVSTGPVMIEVPSIPARYWSLSVFQANTDAAFVRNNVESGGAPIRVTIAQAGQGVSPGRAVARVEGAKGIALIRVLVDDRSRFAGIDAARRLAACRAVAGAVPR